MTVRSTVGCAVRSTVRRIGRPRRRIRTPDGWVRSGLGEDPFGDTQFGGGRFGGDEFGDNQVDDDRLPRDQEGTASLTFPLLLWVASLVAVVTIDIGAYLVAASRAQALADASALAAVSADVVGADAGTPVREADRVAHAGDGWLETCECRRGSERASVTVSVRVPGLIIPTLGASRVSADASAVLAPPEDLAPGPTRERARWPVTADP